MILRLLGAAFLGLSLVSCSRNVDYVKSRAEQKFNAMGYDVLGYEGYSWDIAGGCVWYQVMRKNIIGLPDGTVFQGCLMKWGDELHLYNFKALNAINPTKR